MKKTIDWKKLLVKNSKYILLVVMVIVSALVSDKFFTSTNISNLFKQNAAVGIVALGELVVILTGGIAYNPNTEKYLKEYLGFIAPITVYPGEDELLALCQGALRVMTGEEKPMEY